MPVSGRKRLEHLPAGRRRAVSHRTGHKHRALSDRQASYRVSVRVGRQNRAGRPLDHGKAYKLEDASPPELTDALGSAAAGQGGWRDDERQRTGRWEEKAGRPWRSLGEREREVFHLLVRGLSNSAMAEALSLAPKTVEHHVGKILGKLGRASRTEVMAWYFEQFPPILRGGLIEDEIPVWSSAVD